MANQNSTLAAYAGMAAAYTQRTQAIDMSVERSFFLRQLPPGRCDILDAGCGSGRDITEFLALGHSVQAFDGCAELAAHARSASGVDVKVARFDELVFQSQFDGIWACASLLHLEEADLVDALTRLRRALRPRGVLCAVMKRGEGTSFGSDGRFYRYTSPSDFQHQLAAAGFGTCEWFSADSYIGEPTTWLTFVASPLSD